MGTSFSRVSKALMLHKPDEPFTWNVQIVAFRRADDIRILKDKNGKQFILVVIPGKNRSPSFRGHLTRGEGLMATCPPMPDPMAEYLTYL